MRSATRLPSSSACSTTSSSSARRSASPIAGASRSTSTLVRSEVTGVRSSCEASATSWRCWACEVCRRASIALKRAAMRPTSSWPSASMRRPRSPVASMCSAASVSSVTGAIDAPREQPAHAGRERGADGHERDEHAPQALEDAVGVRERARHLHRADRSRAARSARAGAGRRRRDRRSRRCDSPLAVASGLLGHRQRSGRRPDRAGSRCRWAARAGRSRRGRRGSAAGVRSPGRPGRRRPPARAASRW